MPFTALRNDLDGLTPALTRSEAIDMAGIAEIASERTARSARGGSQPETSTVVSRSPRRTRSRGGGLPGRDTDRTMNVPRELISHEASRPSSSTARAETPSTTRPGIKRISSSPQSPPCVDDIALHSSKGCSPCQAGWRNPSTNQGLPPSANSIHDSVAGSRL